MLFKTISMEDELREPNGVTAGTSIPFWKHDTLTARKEQNPGGGTPSVKVVGRLPGTRWL